MKFHIHILLGCMIASLQSCKKEEAATQAPPLPATGAVTQSESSPPSSSAPSKLAKNSYAEKKWKLEEPATEAEKEFLAATTVEEKLLIIAKQHSIGPEELGPVVRRALRDPDERVRVDAILTTPSFFSEAKEATDIITAGTFDESSEVRAFSMEMALEHPVDTRLMIFDNTINSPNKDVREKTAVELGRHPTKQSYEILMKGLTNPDPEFVSKVNEEIKLLVDQEFPSWREANSWWETNAEKFDERMIRQSD